MRLEQCIFQVKDVQFGGKTELKGGVLYVDKAELTEHLLSDKRLGSVDIDILHPGQSWRVVKVADIIEPRAKADAAYPNFPGALDKQGIVGEGQTNVLRGMSVVTSDDSTKGQQRGPYMAGKILDGIGPAAAMSCFGRLQHVVVYPHAAQGTPISAYKLALKLCGMKAAVYLAKAAQGLKPDSSEVYELPVLGKADRGMEHLPRVAYIMQILMNQMEEIKDEPVLYGDNVHSMLPVVLHPNEILDGALINAYAGGLNDTYTIQNHPTIKELYARHGKDLCFVGVVATISHASEAARLRAAAMNARMAKYVLGADGVIVTKSGGGAPEIDMSDTALACENLGMKTTILMHQMVSKEAGGNLFSHPKLDAIVATATLGGMVKVPAVEKLIGIPGNTFSGAPVDGEFLHLKWNIMGLTDQMGLSHMRSIEY